MSALVSILPHYTYDDYRLWEGRWEIIDGIPYAMSPAPSLRHQLVTANIIGELRNALKSTECNEACKVYNFIDLKISEDTVVQPDVSVVCGETGRLFLDFPPAIVVEVLSPTTQIKDRNAKFDRYQKFGIEYYIIVDVDSNQVEIFKLATGQTYIKQSHDNSDSFIFQLADRCDIRFSFNKIWE
jgi:Uma2 family endonuclease